MTGNNEQVDPVSQRNHRFLSSVSHDLKSPLCAIAGFAELLQREMNRHSAPERWQSIAWRISHSSQGIIEMLDQILSLSRLEVGNEIICPDWTDQLAADLQDVIASLEPQATAKQIAVTLQIPKALPPVRWDLRRVRFQIVTNLLANALKFTPPGGTVAISARAEEEMVVIEVADNGPGVADDERERIFLPFEQGEEGHKVSGSGLGLAHARLVARLHGGDCTVEPRNAGGGARFVARLPIEGPNPVSYPDPAPRMDS